MGEGGLPINMDVMRYRKESSVVLNTIVLYYSTSAEQANIVFEAYYINSSRKQVQVME